MVVVPHIDHANDPSDPGDIEVDDDAYNLDTLLMIEMMTTIHVSHMRISPENQGIFKTMHLMIDDLFVCQLDAGTSPPIP